MFEAKGEEDLLDLKELYIQKFYDFCFSLNVFKFFVSRGTEWEVCHVGGRWIVMFTYTWCGSLLKKNHLEDLEVDGRIIF